MPAAMGTTLCLLIGPPHVQCLSNKTPHGSVAGFPGGVGKLALAGSGNSLS
jgi:hypothetical protein